jgi:hypothetical protein
MPNEPNPTSGAPGCIVLKNQEITPNTMANKQRKRLGSFAPPAPSLRGGEMGRQPAAVLRTGRTLPEAAPEPSRPRPGAPPFDPRQPLLDRLGGRKDVPGALHRRPRPRRETEPRPVGSYGCKQGGTWPNTKSKRAKRSQFILCFQHEAQKTNPIREAGSTSA